jgi:peptidase C39-like protein
MTTGLWLAASGLDGAALLAHVPPGCRRSLDTARTETVDAASGEVLVEAPEWSVNGATHFLPSFAALAGAPYSARLELSVRLAGGAWTPWTAGVGLGPASFAALPTADGLDADIDVFRAREPVDAARLRVRLLAVDAPAVLSGPWMLALSASDATSVPGDRRPTGPGARLDVPALSQMDAHPDIARRICSPTCVAMVLDFWRRPATLEALAAEMFSVATELYGVWPAAIAAAGRRGLVGYLLRFPDWGAAAWCLERGLPIIASVRYAAGELSNAAVPQTAGHLLTLKGWDGDEVLVNDPGAPSAASVPRRYRLDEVTRVWLERTGVGYVLFPPPAAPLRGG